MNFADVSFANEHEFCCVYLISVEVVKHEKQTTHPPIILKPRVKPWRAGHMA